MRLRRRNMCIVFAFISLMANAQIYSSGENPWGTKWWKIETQNFKLIYPQGMDSLAREYGRKLEQYRVPVGRSIGYLPNQSYRAKMPVVLEGFRADANGSVVWTPRRMNLYTGGDALDTDPMPWIDQLTIHESRHVSQMQFGRDGHFRLFHILGGELMAGGLAGLYGGSPLFEGDAVVTETALSRFGRGRSADFLEAYRVALDHGDWRSWREWTYGSLKNYTPDVYKAGYVTLAGIRYLYDDPFFVGSYYESLLGHKWWWFPVYGVRTHLKKKQGVKMDVAFRQIEETFQDIWEENKTSRAPFGEVSTMTGSGRWFTEYRGLTAAGENIFAVRSGYAEAPQMVRITPEGKETRICFFGFQTSSLCYSDSLGRIYWSEVVRDPRWDMRSSSRIRYLDPVSGRKISITRGGRFYNPSPYGKLLSVTEYPLEGGSAVCVMDGDSGRTVRRFEAPDTLQVVETAAVGEALFASAVSADGFGIFQVDKGFRTVLAPEAVKIRQLCSRDGKLYFTSDLNGAREVYELDPGTGDVKQVSNTVYGITSYSFAQGQRGIFYSSLDMDGRMIRRADTVSLKPFELWEHPVAARLSEQEARLGMDAKLSGLTEQHPVRTVAMQAEQEARDSSARIMAANGSRGNDIVCGPVRGGDLPGGGGSARAGSDDYSGPGSTEAVSESIQISGPRRYRKALHAFKTHSWLPVYVNYDMISDFSLDKLYTSVQPGATLFFQNELESVYGTAGVSAVRDGSGDDAAFRPAGHLDLHFRAWYPVVETSLDFNERNAFSYRYFTFQTPTRKGYRITGHTDSRPSFSGRVKMYVPLSFSSGGWFRGITPQISLSFSNDAFFTSQIVQGGFRTMGKEDEMMFIRDVKPGDVRYMSHLTFSLRGYAIQSTPKASVYPRFGIGAEIGAGGRTGLGDFYSHGQYAYLYSYLPGVLRNHGIRVSAMGQRLDGEALVRQSLVSFLPRGYSSSEISSLISRSSTAQGRFTVDYKACVLPVDLSLLFSSMYIRNFELGAHFDYTAFGSSSAAGAGAAKYGRNGTADTLNSGNLYSAGGSVSARFTKFILSSFDFTFGVECSYNGGRTFTALQQKELIKNRLYPGFIFKSYF